MKHGSRGCFILHNQVAYTRYQVPDIYFSIYAVMVGHPPEENRRPIFSSDRGRREAYTRMGRVGSELGLGIYLYIYQV